MLSTINIEIQKCKSELRELINRGTWLGIPKDDTIDGIMTQIKTIFNPTADTEAELRTLISNGRLVLRKPVKGRRPPDAASDFLIRFIVRYAFPASLGTLSKEHQCEIAWLLKKAIFMQHFRSKEKSRANGVDIDGYTIWEPYSEQEPDEIFILNEDSPQESDTDIGLLHERNEDLIDRLGTIIATGIVTEPFDLGTDINQFAEQLRIHAKDDLEYCANNRLIEYLLNCFCIGSVFSERLGCKGKYKDPMLFLLSGLLMSRALGRRDYLERMVRNKFYRGQKSIWDL